MLARMALAIIIWALTITAINLQAAEVNCFHTEQTCNN